MLLPCGQPATSVSSEGVEFPAVAWISNTIQPNFIYRALESARRLYSRIIRGITFVPAPLWQDLKPVDVTNKRSLWENKGASPTKVAATDMKLVNRHAQSYRCIFILRGVYWSRPFHLFSLTWIAIKTGFFLLAIRCFGKIFLLALLPAEPPSRTELQPQSEGKIQSVSYAGVVCGVGRIPRGFPAVFHPENPLWIGILENRECGVAETGVTVASLCFVFICLKEF